MRYRYYFLILFIVLRATFLSAQDYKSRENIIVADTNHVVNDTNAKSTFFSKIRRVFDKERSFVIAPDFGIKPETGFLIGIYYLQVLKLDSASRKSNVESFFDYTEQGQVLCQVKNNLLFNKERFILRGVNLYSKFPSLFWGIGPETTQGMQEPISYEMASITQKLVTSIGDRYFAGIQYHYMRVSNVQQQAGDLFDQQNIPGSKGSVTSGIGLVFLFDSRDNILNSYKGFYGDISILTNPKILGAEYEYTNVTVDLRKFIPLSKNKIRLLAFQALINYNSGNVPFLEMATMGGDQIMRGYYTGRFRDKILMAGQVEFRFLVWKRLGFTTFASLGEVQPDFSVFNFGDVRYTFGACLRFMINKKEKLNTGVDAGFGYKTNGIYTNSGEAF